MRQQHWKLIFGPGSGGWTEGRDEHPGQLYDLGADLGETQNLYAKHPAVVEELTALMAAIVGKGRSTPGAPQENDVEVDWRRFLEAEGKKN